jgi:hypothetical protein
MAEEPSSVQGLNSADALQRGIGLRLDRRFAGVNSRIYVAVGLLMTVLSVGGYALWSEFHGLKADFARARGDTDVIKEQAADQRARLTRLDEKLEKNLAEIVRSIRQAGIPTASPVSTTTPERTSPFVAMTLSDEESEIIRKFFGVKKKDDAVGLEAKVGEVAPDTAPLYPVPSLLYEEIPKLKDHRFFADETKGTIILVRPVDNRVVAIV